MSVGRSSNAIADYGLMGDAQRVGQLPVRIPPLIEEGLERPRLLDGLQVLANAVLDKLVLEELLRASVPLTSTHTSVAMPASCAAR